MSNSLYEIIGCIAEIIECYEIEYANPPHHGERLLGRADSGVGGNTKAADKIGHTHSFYQYIYVLSAVNGYISINSQRYTLCPGTLYMIKPGVMHEIAADELYKIKLIEFKFVPASKKISSIINLFPDMISDNSNNIQNVLLQLANEYKNKIYNDGMADVKVMELIITLQRMCNHDCGLNIAKTNIYEDKQKRFFPVLDYITENFASEITVETLANIVHMEKGYFAKLFKKCFNITPMSYIQTVRLNRALNMIEYSDMSIEKISGEIGFANSNSFIRAFKAMYNQTPTEYRNAIKRDIAQKYK